MVFDVETEGRQEEEEGSELDFVHLELYNAMSTFFYYEKNDF